jgi:NAD(P)-dependent dehydrogenase (short-subunit alcohol dehydrogenase family)
VKHGGKKDPITGGSSGLGFATADPTSWRATSNGAAISRISSARSRAPEELPAIEAAIAADISANVTLLFPVNSMSRRPRSISAASSGVSKRI